MIEFLQANWIWVVLLIAIVGMHSFGGGCCGGGHRPPRNKASGDRPEEAEGGSCH